MLDNANKTVCSVTIASTRKRATLEWSNLDQDILFEPGGPGKPGVNLALGHTFDNYTVTEYNLVRFHPRSVAKGGPFIDFIQHSLKTTNGLNDAKTEYAFKTPARQHGHEKKESEAVSNDQKDAKID